MEVKAYSSPEVYEVANQLRRGCSKQDVPVDKNQKQRKDKFSILQRNRGP